MAQEFLKLNYIKALYVLQFQLTHNNKFEVRANYL